MTAPARGGNPVPASREAGKYRGGADKVSQAADLYRRFTGNEPWKEAQVVVEPDRDTFLRVGTVDGILYTTNRDGKREKYIHNFRPQSRPALLVSEDGKVARTHGGDFTFTERGFVDEEKGQPVE